VVDDKKTIRCHPIHRGLRSSCRSRFSKPLRSGTGSPLKTVDVPRSRGLLEWDCYCEEKNHDIITLRFPILPFSSKYQVSSISAHDKAQKNTENPQPTPMMMMMMQPSPPYHKVQSKKKANK
jgi:hypothetical protein